MNRRFKLHPSIFLTALFCVGHGAVLMVLPLLGLPGWASLLLAAAVLCSLIYRLWRDAWLRAPGSCCELLLLEGRDALLQLRNGNQLRGGIAHGSLVTPCLTVLNIALPERPGVRGVVILPDSMDKEAFRQLRVWLKWGYQEAE